MNQHTFHIALAVVFFVTAVALLITGSTYYERRRHRVFWLLFTAAFAIAIAGAFQVGWA